MNYKHCKMQNIIARCNVFLAEKEIVGSDLPKVGELNQKLIAVQQNEMLEMKVHVLKCIFNLSLSENCLVLTKKCI